MCLIIVFDLVFRLFVAMAEDGKVQIGMLDGKNFSW